MCWENKVGYSLSYSILSRVWREEWALRSSSTCPDEIIFLSFTVGLLISTSDSIFLAGGFRTGRTSVTVSLSKSEL